MTLRKGQGLSQKFRHDDGGCLAATCLWRFLSRASADSARSGTQRMRIDAEGARDGWEAARRRPESRSCRASVRQEQSMGAASRLLKEREAPVSVAGTLLAREDGGAKAVGNVALCAMSQRNALRFIARDMRWAAGPCHEPGRIRQKFAIVNGSIGRESFTIANSWHSAWGNRPRWRIIGLTMAIFWRNGAAGWHGLRWMPEGPFALGSGWHGGVA